MRVILFVVLAFAGMLAATASGFFGSRVYRKSFILALSFTLGAGVYTSNVCAYPLRQQALLGGLTCVDFRSVEVSMAIKGIQDPILSRGPGVFKTMYFVIRDRGESLKVSTVTCRLHTTRNCTVGIWPDLKLQSVRSPTLKMRICSVVFFGPRLIAGFPIVDVHTGRYTCSFCLS